MLNLKFSLQQISTQKKERNQHSLNPLMLRLKKAIQRARPSFTIRTRIIITLIPKFHQLQASHWLDHGKSNFLESPL